MLIKVKFRMRKVKKYLNPMKAILNDYWINARKSRILIRGWMLKLGKMKGTQIAKDYAMKYLNIWMKNRVKMMTD